MERKQTKSLKIVNRDNSTTKIPKESIDRKPSPCTDKEHCAFPNTRSVDRDDSTGASYSNKFQSHSRLPTIRKLPRLFVRYQSYHLISKPTDNKLEGVTYVDATEEMNQRWLKKITKYTPTIDLSDLSYETYPFNSLKR